MMQEFWNDRYSQDEMIYGSEPNEFFREQLKSMRPGRLLLPAEGEGRNAVYAALMGWEVEAFDYSEAGHTKARRLAHQRGVSFRYEVTDVSTFKASPNSFDAVALIYAHFQPDIRQAFHQQVVQWLKPGGTLILEAFHPKQLAYTSGGPKNEALLYSADLLRRDFQGLQVQQLEEQEIQLAEGGYHSGTGFVTRLVATKPNDLNT